MPIATYGLVLSIKGIKRKIKKELAVAGTVISSFALLYSVFVTIYICFLLAE